MSEATSYLDWFRNAAPYFNAHRGRCIVVHFAGGRLRGPDVGEFIHDLAVLQSLGVRLVLVPGIRPQVEDRLHRASIESELLDGMRLTDAATMPVVMDAAAEVCAELTSRLSMGLASSPMQGARIRVAQGNYITARPVGVLDGLDYGFSGQVRRVDAEAIELALGSGAVVLVPPVGYSPTGEVFNLHAATLAADVAVELRAHKLVLLGHYPTIHDERGQRIGNLGLAAATRRLAEMRADPAVRPDQVRRFAAALRACRNGVRRVHMVDGQRRGALPLELYTRDGVGTMITSDAYDDLRRATIDDVAGILDLIEPLEREGILVRRERRDIEHTIDHYFVEERDGAIVACAAAHPYPDESVVELACLAVKASYRESGRGDRLLEAVEDEARRLGATRLVVLTTQTTHWFRERGFETADIDSLPMERRTLYNYQRRSRVLVKPLAG